MAVIIFSFKALSQTIKLKTFLVWWVHLRGSGQKSDLRLFCQKPFNYYNLELCWKVFQHPSPHQDIFFLISKRGKDQCTFITHIYLPCLFILSSCLLSVLEMLILIVHTLTILNAHALVVLMWLWKRIISWHLWLTSFTPANYPSNIPSNNYPNHCSTYRL